VRLVVSIVPARVQVHLRGRGIDTMWRRSFTRRPGEHVVCLVVLIVVGRQVRVLADVASGPVLFHVQPPAIGARLAAERSPSLIIRAIEDRRHGCRLVNGFVNERQRDRGDDVERFLIAPTPSSPPCNRSCHLIVARRSTGLENASHRDCATTQFADEVAAVADRLATGLHGWRQNAGDVVVSEQADSQLSEHYAGLYWQMHNAGGGSGRAKALRGRRAVHGYRAARHHY
jgi:hypothetical protein